MATVESPPDAAPCTLADLIDRLGGIPPSGFAPFRRPAPRPKRTFFGPMCAAE